MIRSKFFIYFNSICSRFGPPPASKKSVEDLLHSSIADFADSNVECCVCQELFKNYTTTKPEIGDNDEAMIP